MTRFFHISVRQRTAWLGLIFTAAAVTVTATLSINAFRTDTASAASATNGLRELTVASQIDQTARAKYLADQETKRAADQAARQTAQTTQTTSTKTAVVRTAATPKNTAPKSATTCDRLIIPKIGLNACLATVGLAANGAVDVHPNLPAWFNQSSRAGTNGGKYSATFIDGHRSGIFRNLGQLAIGDTITVVFTTGETYSYTVRATEITPLAAVDMQKALSIYGGARQGLNLMTCDGAYNARQGTAERRLTIYAGRD